MSVDVLFYTRKKNDHVVLKYKHLFDRSLKDQVAFLDFFRLFNVAPIIYF